MGCIILNHIVKDYHYTRNHYDHVFGQVQAATAVYHGLGMR